MLNDSPLAVPIGAVTAACVWAAVVATAVATAVATVVSAAVIAATVVVGTGVVAPITRAGKIESRTSLLPPVQAPLHQSKWPVNDKNSFRVM